MQYLPHQQQGYAVHSHFTSQQGVYFSQSLMRFHFKTPKWFCLLYGFRFEVFYRICITFSAIFLLNVSSFSPSAGYIPSAGIPLQKQLEHANQQSGFTDSVSRTYKKIHCDQLETESQLFLIVPTCHLCLCEYIGSCVSQSPLRPMHPQALHVSAAGLLPTPSIAVQIPPGKVRAQISFWFFLVCSQIL